ncbi:hypothetical protein [Microbispora sp. CL1-1]|uniref:hypothetical protein n=1 Tax=Microbispora sp. CL1-1 TaxID=2720026 RepID=UPI00321635C8
MSSTLVAAGSAGSASLLRKFSNAVRALPHPHDQGDLGVRQVEVAAQHQRLPLAPGQPGQREQHREPHQADPVLAIQARQIGPGRRCGRSERRRP